ncbi:retrovirus-related Pol polyprotein from transposon 17.6 [Trichonephila clavipes]|nr:retrovirus-related Pol polyprotein from transposon 17.6 [Trichonephila clavipes]
MTKLPQGHEKFDLSYLDNVVVFSDFPIDHMDAILERNTRLAVRPAECELAQNGVEYRGHIVGSGKRSPAKLKVWAIIDFSISRYKTQVKVLGLERYDRQYIPMFSRLVTPVTETLKRKSKKRDIKWTSECPEFFRQLEENLSTNSVLFASDFTKRFIFPPKHFLFIFSYAEHKF